jgi:hypothetical protein
MFGWWRKKKANVAEPDDTDILRELKRHRVTAPGHTLTITGFDDEWKSGPVETLYDLLETYTYLFHFIITKGKMATSKMGNVSVPLHPERRPIWKQSYFKLFHDGCKAFGLKLYKDPSDKVWYVAKCLECDFCERRVDCLVDEVQ